MVAVDGECKREEREEKKKKVNQMRVSFSLVPDSCGEGAER
jgi:hypothetical protein